MKELIVKLLPEIEEIQNRELKSQVIACWDEAINFRGWTEKLLRKIPFTLLADNVKIPFIDHVRAVCRMCMATDDVLTEVHGANKTRVNRDYLIAG
ncbi:MAG: hypothetical protein ACE5K8_07610, partial [Candidatus Zixiibacteriota bacterium]